jgi:hypothetical protein
MCHGLREGFHVRSEIYQYRLSAKLRLVKSYKSYNSYLKLYILCSLKSIFLGENTK